MPTPDRPPVRRRVRGAPPERGVPAPLPSVDVDRRALRHPVGPLPPAVYWRRRAVILLALLVVSLGSVRAFGSAAPTGSGAPPVPAGAARPTATGTATSPVPVAATPSPPRVPATPSPAAGEAGTRPPASATSAALPACADDALRLVVATDARSYPAAAQPRLTLTATNTGPASCLRDLGSRAVEWVIYSGVDRIWSSADCPPTASSEIRTLAPGVATSVALTWPRVRSDPQCKGGPVAALPGTYVLLGRAGNVKAPGAVFVLE